jgi:hypothetical protein
MMVNSSGLMPRSFPSIVISRWNSSQGPPAFVVESQYLEGVEMIQGRIAASKGRNGFAGCGFGEFDDVGAHEQALPGLSAFSGNEVRLEREKQCRKLIGR